MHKNLVALNLPDADLKLAKQNDKLMVWDAIRKKYLVLTPEEWVRQHFVNYLISSKGYPQSAFALETGFQLFRKLQRSDILVFKDSRPRLLVECKAPQVKLSQETLDQASRYNLHYDLQYVLLTNGLVHIASQIKHEEQAYKLLKEIPSFDEL